MEGEDGLCLRFFEMFAQRLRSHSWLAAELPPLRRDATTFDGGMSGCGEDWEGPRCFLISSNAIEMELKKNDVVNHGGRLLPSR
jgi:hypothetical protein